MFRNSVNYDPRLEVIDEKICALIQKRKSISEGRPGIPSEELLQQWSRKYGIYKDLLDSIFSNLRNEEEFRPRVVPQNFRRILPVMQGKEIDGCFYYVTHIRQYDNASVLSLNISLPKNYTESFSPKEEWREDSHRYFDLQLEISGFDCRSDSGSGSEDQYMMDYIIAPALPDNYSGLDLVFKESQECFKETSGGVIEMVFHLDRRGDDPVA